MSTEKKLRTAFNAMHTGNAAEFASLLAKINPEDIDVDVLSNFVDTADKSLFELKAGVHLLRVGIMTQMGMKRSQFREVASEARALAACLERAADEYEGDCK